MPSHWSHANRRSIAMRMGRILQCTCRVWSTYCTSLSLHPGTENSSHRNFKVFCWFRHFMCKIIILCLLRPVARRSWLRCSKTNWLSTWTLRLGRAAMGIIVTINSTDWRRALSKLLLQCSTGKIMETYSKRIRSVVRHGCGFGMWE